MRSFIIFIFGVNFLALIVSCSNPLSAQEPWEFYFAFEDATGARDTVWYIMHSDGTNGIDIELGEVVINLDSGEFNAYIECSPFSNEGCKRIVTQFSCDAGANLFCNNYVVPITVSWDTSLFQSSVLLEFNGLGMVDASLANPYISQIDGPDYSMTDNTTCFLTPGTWPGTPHFPLQFYASCLPFGGLSAESLTELQIQTFPNPSNTFTTIYSPAVIKELNLINSLGQTLRRLEPRTDRVELDMSGLAAGIYLVEVITEQGRGVEKVVVE